MSIINNQTAIVLNPGTKEDRYGNETDDWDNPVPTYLSDCSVQPSTTEEIVENQQTTVADWRFYSEDPAAAALTARSRLECLGQTYEVVGAPQPWPDPLNPGGIDHWEAPLRIFDPNPNPEG